MSDQRLQEAWSRFAQTDPGHVAVGVCLALHCSIGNFLLFIQRMCGADFIHEVHCGRYLEKREKIFYWRFGESL